MIYGFQVSGLSRSLDNPLNFTVTDGKVRGPASYRVLVPVDVQNGVILSTRIDSISTSVIISRLQTYVAHDKETHKLNIPVVQEASV